MGDLERTARDQRAQLQQRGLHNQLVQQDAAMQQRVYGMPYGAPRTLVVEFAANGYIVTERNRPTQVFVNAPSLTAYLNTAVGGGPGGDVRPVDPDQAGLDLTIPDRGGDYTMEDTQLNRLDSPVLKPE